MTNLLDEIIHRRARPDQVGHTYTYPYIYINRLRRDQPIARLVTSLT